MSQEEKKELFNKLDETKKTIQRLRDSLNLIDSQKEQWFLKKEAIGRQIVALISEAKKAKTERNIFTDSAKKSKSERQTFVVSLKEKIELLNILNQQKAELMKKFDIKDDPEFLKREIEKLEYGLETNVCSFEKEKQMMKRIKSLKKRYSETKDVSGVNERIRELSKDVRKLKRDAEEKHKEVQKSAQQSQQFHTTVLDVGKRIEDLKGEEEEAHKKFADFKQEFNDVNAKLKEQLTILNQFNQQLSLTKEDARKENKQKIEEELKSKEEIVQEKFRSGKKLTTEDILILQQGQDN